MKQGGECNESFEFAKYFYFPQIFVEGIERGLLQLLPLTQAHGQIIISESCKVIA